jgi:hypothetical protein
MLIISLIAWVFHFGIAAILSAPILYFGRKRYNWQPREWLVLVIPFGVWFVVTGFIGSRPKSLSNVFIEPLILGLAFPFAALCRVIVGTRISERVCVASLIAVLSLVAVGVYYTFPCLPE